MPSYEDALDALRLTNDHTRLGTICLLLTFLLDDWLTLGEDDRAELERMRLAVALWDSGKPTTATCPVCREVHCDSHCPMAGAR